MKIRHNSISEKLSTINLDFFKQSYEAIYEQFNKLYSPEEQEQMHLIRVNSSMVCQAGTKLQEGMSVGSKKTKDTGNEKRQVRVAIEDYLITH